MASELRARYHVDCGGRDVIGERRGRERALNSELLYVERAESVSNTASNQIGLKAVCVQYLNNLERTGIKNPRSELVIADALGCWWLGFFAPKKIEHLFQDDSRGPRC